MKHGRKISGGKYHANRKMRLHEHDSQTRIVKLGEEKRKISTVRGGRKKAVMLTSNIANIFDKKSKKSKKAKIKNVLETPSNKFLARQNVLTKGAVIETDIGKARITNRPSQEGSVQAISID